MGAATTVGLWVAAIGCGVMAGTYFAFSTFVMKALDAIPRQNGIAAMQSINSVILSSAFMPLFFGTSLLTLGLIARSLTHWGEPGAAILLVGGTIYLLGMFACTAVFNVPLNDSLAALDPKSAEAATLWSDYLGSWTRWNHLRTIASAAACGIFIFAIATRT